MDNKKWWRAQLKAADRWVRWGQSANSEIALSRSLWRLQFQLSRRKTSDWRIPAMGCKIVLHSFCPEMKDWRESILRCKYYYSQNFYDGKVGADFCAGRKRRSVLTSSPKDFRFLLDWIKQRLLTFPQIPTRKRNKNCYEKELEKPRKIIISWLNGAIKIRTKSSVVNTVKSHLQHIGQSLSA